MAELIQAIITVIEQIAVVVVLLSLICLGFRMLR
jgi:hypothetical protein